MAKKDLRLKKHLLSLIEGKGAHADFQAAIKGLPKNDYGRMIKGLPYSLWQLLEHIRLAQHDILEYIRDPSYKSPSWPESYWPKTQRPPKSTSWKESLKKFYKDYDEIRALLQNPNTDLFAQIVHGEKGHTLLREILLIADHNAYHIGQFVLIRRLLGNW